MLFTRVLRSFCLAALIVAAVTVSAGTARTSSSDPLTLLATIETGGHPEALTVDTCHNPWQVLFYDRGYIRFLDATSLTIASTSLNLPNYNIDRWMAFDRGLCLAYWVTVRDQWPSSVTHWEEARVHVIDDRETVATFSVNNDWNEGLSPPPDSKYKIGGLAFKGSDEDTGGLGRLVLDNVPMGRVDVIDMDASGKKAGRIQRLAYRDPVPEPSWADNLGNSLALEPRHETLSPDDLAANDVLYIADLNNDATPGQGYIRAYRLNHAGFNLSATPLPMINLNGTWPFFNGLDGLSLAGPRDRLYIASGSASFSTGYLGRLDTTNHSSIQVINLLYGDLGWVLADWYDTNRVFILTYDDVGNDPDHGLYLHLVYDSTVVDTLQLKKNYDPHATLSYSLAFDPYLRQFYLGIDSQIMVVGVDYGLAALPLPCVGCPHLYLPVMRK